MCFQWKLKVQITKLKISVFQVKSVKCFLLSCCKLVERRKMHKRPPFALNTLLTTWKAYVVTKGVTTSYCQCKAFIMSCNWVWWRGVGCHRLRVEGECEECNNNAFMISSATQNVIHVPLLLSTFWFGNLHLPYEFWLSIISRLQMATDWLIHWHKLKMS